LDDVNKIDDNNSKLLYYSSKITLVKEL